MFLFLSKLLPPLVFPPGGNLVLFLLAWFLRKRRPRLAGALFLVSALTLYALSTQWGSGVLIAPLENWYADVGVESAPQADAIVVLGGGVQAAAGRHKEPELAEAGDRIRKGAALYKAGKAPIILDSGGNIDFLDGAAEPEAVSAGRILESLGIPATALVAESKSRNTHENAEMTWSLLSARGAHRILLVTSATHMPRSVALFRRAGFVVIPVPCNHIAGWGEPSLLFSLLPEPQPLADSRGALREYMGLTVYWLRGWL
ncbi:MAG: YdcF family protein [Bryobacteraceae bacterium]|jgi:uncharacterized SAM-binding protein YcdF (DUF218 family)